MTRNISKDLFQCVTDHRVNKPHSLYTESHSYLILHLVTFGQHLLDVSDRFGGVESLGTGLGAVHDRVAAVELEAVVQSLQSLLSLLVTRVNDPAVGLRERQSQTAIGVGGEVTCMRMAGPRYLSAFHQYEGQEVEQQAQRMHSYSPSSFFRSSFDCRNSPCARSWLPSTLVCSQGLIDLYWA